MTASYVNPVNGTAFLTHQDLLVVLAALKDAAEYRSQHADADDQQLVIRYQAISRGLGDNR